MNTTASSFEITLSIIGSLTTELFAGYRYPGGLLGLSLTAYLVSRLAFFNVPLGLLGDIIAPAFGFAMALARVGCLLAGCCFGRISDLPWAIRFPERSPVWHAQVTAGLLDSSAPLSLPVHPLQLYFGLLSLGLGIFALWFQSRKQYQGQVFLIFLAVHDTGKFFLEFLRSQRLPHLQLLSAAAGAAAMATLGAQAIRRRSFRSARGPLRY